MATNSGIRVTKNTLSSAISVYEDNIRTAAENALYEAVKAGTEEMVKIIKTAVTKTGELRHPRNPGRIDSGDMLNSIWDEQFSEPSNSYREREARTGTYVVDFGFLDPTPYTRYQELDGEGNNDAIAAMHSVQAGFNTFQITLFSSLEMEMRAAGNDASANKLLARISRLRKTQ